MTLLEWAQLLITVAVGAGSTLLTLYVSMSRLQERQNAADKRLQDAIDGFREETRELSKAISGLSRTVAQMESNNDHIEQLYELVRNIEKDVAVLKDRALLK